MVSVFLFSKQWRSFCKISSVKASHLIYNKPSPSPLINPIKDRFTQMRKLALCAHIHPEGDDLDFTPKPKHQFKGRDKNKKNPYSTRGLDKFSALLADLDEKRRMIYSQLDGKDIVLVQFVYDDSNTCVPVVVKLRRKEKEDKSADGADSLEKLAIDSSTTTKAMVEARQDSDKTMREKRVLHHTKLERRVRPSTYLTLAAVMILVFLAFFGKPISILCTGLAWYSVPTLKRRPKRVTIEERLRQKRVRFSISR